MNNIICSVIHAYTCARAIEETASRGEHFFVSKQYQIPTHRYMILSPKILSWINYENLFSHKYSSRSIQYLNILLCFQSVVSLSPRTSLKQTNFVLCLAYLRCLLSCAMTSRIRSLKNLQKVYKLQYHGSLFKCICSAL